MITNFRDRIKDSDSWLKSTFVVQIGSDYTTYFDMIEAALIDGDSGRGKPTSNDSSALAGMGEDAPLPVYYSKRTCRDTALGGNDAINSYYSFNEDDDILHPFTMTDYGASGLGRVYKEIYNDTQQIVYLTFGMPVWNNLSSFYKDTLVPELASLMMKGTIDSGASIGYLIGSTIGTIAKLPVMPLLYLNKWLGSIGDSHITKYYDFAQAMPLYYRFVNSMIIHLAVNMGLSNDGFFMDGGGSSIGTTGSTTQPAITYDELARESASSAGDTSVGLEELFRNTNLDILKILSRRWYYESGNGAETIQSTDEALQEWMSGGDQLTNTALSVKNYLDKFIMQADGAMHDAPLFVGFRIEKSTDSSESLQNQTGVSEIAQTVNAKIQAARNFNFSTAFGNFSDGAVGQVLDTFIKGIKDFSSGLTQSVGLDGIAAAVTGAGLIDFPEVWMDSSFSKNYSFTIELRTPYGDPYSIFQTIYVPMALILAGALPRATGPTSYQQPFLCRAYCKGMFSVPCGIIESINITRGADQFGWNFQRLPTVVRLSFTIKDLSPAMYMAMGDASLWQSTFGQNSTFQEYLLTLSGIGMQDRLRYLKNIRRKAQIMLQTVYANRLSPYHWGMEIANSIPGRVLTALTPGTGIPNN